ncbi:MAG: chromate transporter [Clostridia bacterium]|nr:chromate transporter [Clostridia bacterium]
MKKLKEFFVLFFSMLKIGLFTFGGGYAMISLLDRECVERRKWLSSDEFVDLVTIAESTPGPIAINCATYVGYKHSGVLGAVGATLGMCTPSFVIIYIISLFFDSFLSIGWVAEAFRGIQACVIFLILSAGIKMLRKMKKSAFNITIAALTFLSMVILSLFAVGFSSIFYILISGGIGLLIFAIKHFNGARGREGEKK